MYIYIYIDTYIYICIIYYMCAESQTPPARLGDKQIGRPVKTDIPRAEQHHWKEADTS